MSRSERPASRLELLAVRLSNLSVTNRDAAIQLAVSIVGRERAHRVLEPALDLLAEAAPADSRGALRDRFLDLTDNGTRYDQDCSLRVRLIRALRAIGSPHDGDLAERGVRTVQLMPPTGSDVAHGLRGQSLLWLADLAPNRADYFAVELLVDPNTSPFSGEPAVTAIQVLAARGQILPIWVVAARPGAPPDVLAQAFASLRRAPPDLQLIALRKHLDLARQQGESGEAVALVAAEAIILNGLSEGYPDVAALLRATPNPNLCLYLAATALRAGDDALRRLIQQMREHERDPRNAAAFAAALGEGRT